MALYRMQKARKGRLAMEEGFLLDLQATELFFRVCRRYGVEGREPRIALLRILRKRGQAKYLRDVSEFTSGKKVLRVQRKGGINEN